MEMSREQEALKAYVRLLSAKGISKRALIQREFIIIRLTSFLQDIPGDGNHYRQAVDRFVASIDPAEMAAVLPVIREFFSFWVKDIKAIAAMNQAQVFSGAVPVSVASQDELFKYWYDLDKTSLSMAEQTLMDSFNESCLARGLDMHMLKERMRMAKFLLVSLRAVTYKQSHSYRQMVDRNLPLFNALGTQHAYLSVAREFYYFWRGDIAERKPQQKVAAMALAA